VIERLAELGAGGWLHRDGRAPDEGGRAVAVTASVLASGIAVMHWVLREFFTQWNEQLIQRRIGLHF
jgi:hypothetical protein